MLRTVFSSLHESRSSVAGIKAPEFKLTRLLQTCVAGKLVSASLRLIRDSIAGSGLSVW